MLESRFQHATKFREASDLKTAVGFLKRGDIDCILLDLILPDSVGKETFTKLSSQYPSVPIIVMTNTKDRDLAIELVRLGAADYMIKNYTDEESVFQRILVAIEKHKYTVRVPEEAAASVKRVEQAQARLLTAQQSGEHVAVQQGMVETTATTADLTRKMFTEVQKIQGTLVAYGKDLTHTSEIAEKLQREFLEGSLTRPSLKSRVEKLEGSVSMVLADTKGEAIEQTQLLTQVKLLEQSTKRLYSDIRGLKGEEKSRNSMASQMGIAQTGNRTRLIVAFIALMGVIAGGIIAAYAQIKANEDKTPASKVEQP